MLALPSFPVAGMMSLESCFAMYRIMTERNSHCKPLKSRDWHASSSWFQKYEQSYVCLIYNTVFTENFLSKTCLRAVRELADKEACGPAGQSLPPHCQRGKQQEECLRAEGGPSEPHALQTRGVCFGPREAGAFHSHTRAPGQVPWCICLWEVQTCNQIVLTINATQKVFMLLQELHSA